MFKLHHLATLALICSLLNYINAANNVTIEVGLEVCITGYVMDLFCIDRGTLFDNRAIVTLEQPDRHSYHCLLDVPQCIRSGYEILLDRDGDETIYKRGIRLDDSGNQRVLSVGRSHGSDNVNCDTCTGVNDQQTHGFRATVIGTLRDLGTETVLPTLTVTQLDTPSNLDCPADVTDVRDIYDQFVFRDQDGSMARATFARQGRTHGILMMIGWGFLLPAGAILARFGKHRDPLWFHLHRVIQTVGLILALSGFIYALVRFDALSAPGFSNYYHAVLGIVVMVLGLLQPVNALLRPHKPSDGEAKSTSRFIWEILHKSSGWFACILAVAVIGIGTTILPESNKAFQITYGVLGAIIVFGLSGYLLLFDKKEAPEKEQDVA